MVGAGSETSRPLTSRRAPGCASSTSRKVSSATSSRYGLGLVAAEEHDRAVLGGTGPGVNRSTSTAFGRISHVPRAGPRKSSADRLLNALW